MLKIDLMLAISLYDFCKSPQLSSTTILSKSVRRYIYIYIYRTLFEFVPIFCLGNILLSFYSIYMHLLSNHNLYVGCSSSPTISTYPKIISCIPSPKKLINFILVFKDSFVYKELHCYNHIFCKYWGIFLNTLEL